ncbi:sensor histidine kinase [Vibrio intestinalis]|uniref:sensor histidine kinase n=1 Tax=Vibrio intestinalis TaxID=2933291 RepID=UPI0021A5E007
MRLRCPSFIEKRKDGLAFNLFSYMSLVVLSILLLQAITEKALVRTTLVLPDSLKAEMQELAHQANVLIEEGDMDELADWERAQPFYLFVLDSDKQPLSHRKMHPHFEFKLRFLRKLDDLMNDRVNKPLIGQPLVGQNLLVIQLPSELHPAHLFLNYLMVSKFVIAFAIMGLFSLIIARQLQKPLDRLREASHRVAMGDFDVNVVSELQSNTREFNELAQDFDNMSQQIHSLATKQKQLIRDVSHELRTPLARQNLALHLLKYKVDPSDLHLVERAEREVEIMDSLVDEILTYSRLENARYEVEMTELNLQTCIEGVITQSRLALKPNQTLLSNLNEFLPHALADQRLVARCVQNLITNSIKYAGSDARIDVKTMQRSHRGQNHLVIAVEDDGKGIDADKLKEIFTPFTRLDTARDKQSGGYGLGLAIVKESMKLMGGHVYANNRPQGGLCIELLFKLA